jgi:hypothetical protein
MSLALIISILSLIISFFTLYISHLRNPSIEVHVGPEIRIYHADYDYGFSTGIYLPVAFLNKGAKIGAIIKTAISLRREDLPDQTFFMQWREFSKLDSEKSKWINEEVAHPLTLPPKSAVDKIIWYMWYAKSKPQLELVEASYVLTFYFWDKIGHEPKKSEHRFSISKEVATQFVEFRKTRIKHTIDILLDKELEINRLLTLHEKEKLLGK